MPVLTPCATVEATGYDPVLHTVDFGAAGTSVLSMQTSLLTATTANGAFIGSDGNIDGDPDFLNGYLNGGRGILDLGEFTTLQTAAAFDEGGNFIQVDFRPAVAGRARYEPQQPRG